MAAGMTESLISDAVPSVAVEETVEQARDFVPLNETTAILASHKQRQPEECSLDKLDQLYADIRATVVRNPDLLFDASEQLLRVKSQLSARSSKLAIPRLPAATSKEPANKKTQQQRHFLSTGKQCKRKLDSSLSKPDAAEIGSFLLQIGNVEVVSRLTEAVDHNYDTSAGNTVLSEHCYDGGRCPILF